MLKTYIYLIVQPPGHSYNLASTPVLERVWFKLYRNQGTIDFNCVEVHVDIFLVVNMSKPYLLRSPTSFPTAAAFK